MSAQQQGNIAGPSNKEAFAFVQPLALEMSAGKIEIPSFPDVAVRIRKVLADENCDTGQIARVVSAEPAMAARLLQMANSAALNPNGAQDHRTQERHRAHRVLERPQRIAGVRDGPDQERPVAAPIRKPLNELWERSVKVAAMAFVVARRWTKVNADQALLAGLMHGMGRVYILTRAVKHPALFADARPISRSCATGTRRLPRPCWRAGRSPRKSSMQSRTTRTSSATGSGDADLTDVLTIANLLVSFHTDPASPRAAPAADHGHRASRASRRDACQKVLQETAGELASLRHALGG